MDFINIVMASDDNYAQHMGVAIISILRNKKDNYDINFHILDGGLSEINQNKIKKIIENANQKVYFYKTDNKETEKFPQTGYVSRATCLRLLITDILPKNIQKVLYLDCDIVVLKDLYDLYNYDLGDKPLAAVRDIKSTEILRIYFYPNLYRYFNAGVLLINLNFWRNQKIISEFISFTEKYSEHLIMIDQDILNCVFRNNWIELDKKYNIDLKEESHGAMPPEDTVIFHYSDKIKPWSYLYYGKNKKYYFHYLAMSPWSSFKYTDKNTKKMIKKIKLIVIKYLKNKIRPIMPNNILDIYKRYMLKTVKKNYK